LQTATYALVLASTATHAYWNYLLKRARGGTVFIGLSKIFEVVLFAPAFLWWSIPEGRNHLDAWPIVLGGALLTLASYVALAQSYRLADLSVAYPVARGGTLLFLPILGFAVFGERISAVGWFALASIVLGIVLLQMSSLSASALRAVRARLGERSVGLALGAAVATAAYTTWDKWAVQTLPPFAYFYAYTALIAAAYAGYLWRSCPAAALRDELRRDWRAIAQVAVCNTVTYLLVLLALRSGTSSYVVALRQLGIAVGALLGWRLLGEPFGAPRALGVALIVAGCLLVGLAP
jgi:drug/metabolite transporter (DMT)-like permease